MNWQRQHHRGARVGMRGLGGLLLAATLAAPLVVVAPAAPAAAAADRVLTNGEILSAGTVIPAGEVWEFNPNADTTVKALGNLVVEGTLRMRPANGNVEHLLQFTGVVESQFVGGGHTPLASDDGLWVVGAGRLDISGTPVTPWSYEWEAGWSSTDDIVAAPNTPGNYTTFTQVNSAAAVPAPNPLGYKAELLNLTRNVRIEGLANAKTHVFIKSTSPQTIKYAAIRYVAPWFKNSGITNGGTDHLTGRYGLHFHHAGNGSRGSIVEGVVVRDADNHAFVPHASHGIVFSNTIAYNTTSEAYWWDESSADRCGESNLGCNETSDLIYDSVVAAKITPNPNREHGAAAIQLGAGDNMVIANSVVVGMGDTGQNVAAYHWPSKDRGVWSFVGNVAHNNSSHGIFVWQNTAGDEDKNHVIDGYTAYYNRSAGIDHGAYGNAYVYRNLTLLENGTDPSLGSEQDVAIHSHALGKPSSTTTGPGATDTQEWNLVVTGGAKLLVLTHNVAQDVPVRFMFCDFGEVVFEEGSGSKPGGYDFIECGLDESDFDRANISPNTVIRVQDGGTAYRLVGKGSRQTIAPFFANPTPPPPPGTKFLDTIGSIFADDIEWLADRGITKGCNPPTNNLFCPYAKVTRGQLAAFLNRALDLPPGTGDPFVDDDGSVFEADIEALAASGITKGCNPPKNDLFCPGDFVTRGQMAAFLARALKLTAGIGNTFIDDNTSIFEADIEALAASGITRGCNPPTNNLFCPSALVTRAQMAAFLHRAEDHLP